jgi:hypothetical protein
MNHQLTEREKDALAEVVADLVLRYGLDLGTATNIVRDVCQTLFTIVEAHAARHAVPDDVRLLLEEIEKPGNHSEEPGSAEWRKRHVGRDGGTSD